MSVDFEYATAAESVDFRQTHRPFHLQTKES
jgi:hypothetical protein